MEEEYLILEVTNDLVYNKLVQEMNSGQGSSIDISNNYEEVKIGNFRFKGEFAETIGTQIILNDSTPIGMTDKIILLNLIIKSEN